MLPVSGFATAIDPLSDVPPVIGGQPAQPVTAPSSKPQVDFLDFVLDEKQVASDDAHTSDQPEPDMTETAGDEGTDLTGWSEIASEIDAAASPAETTAQAIDTPGAGETRKQYRARVE